MAYRKLPRGTRQKISEYFEHRYQVKILFIHKINPICPSRGCRYLVTVSFIHKISPRAKYAYKQVKKMTFVDHEFEKGQFTVCP